MAVHRINETIMHRDRSELRSLIARAVDNTAVLLPRAGDPGLSPLGTEQFRDLASQLQHSPETVRNLAGRYMIADSDGHAALARHLRSSSSLDRYFDETREHLTCIASPSFSVSVPLPLAAASSRIIMSAILNSVDTATDVLHDFLENGSLPITLVLLLGGTRVSQEVALDDYSKLIPASDALAVIRTSSPGPPEPFPLDGDMPMCALVLETKVRPGTYGPHDHVAPVVDMEGLAEIGTDALCGFLTLISRRPFHPFAQTHMIDRKIIDTLPVAEHFPVGGWGVVNHLVPLLPSKSSLPYLDTHGLQSVVEGYRAAGEEVRRRLRLPLARFRAATARLDYTDRCIDLAIAFEAMLTTRPERHITKRLAERAAWLYAETEQERSWATERMRRFYRHRSDIGHGEPVSADSDLYSDAASIFIVCLRNIVARQAYPAWNSIDVAGTLGNPATADPSSILSVKHDTTSWTIGELESIDGALSSHWQDVLDPLPAGPGNGMIHTHDVLAAVADLERSGEPYVVADPVRLRDVHPMWREVTENNNEARIWHCGEDIRSHVRRWTEAALQKGLTVVVDSTSSFLKGHGF